MHQTLAILTFETTGRGLLEVTDAVNGWIGTTGIGEGLVTLFCQHTSASLLITENASPAVWRDLARWLDRAVPEGAGYEHASEGPDDMPAHVKAMLTGTGLTVPFVDGAMTLGTWQGVFLAEHRRAAHRRKVAVHAMGE
jgi:secondary thiamine-phosphate synthase enzyme